MANDERQSSTSAPLGHAPPSHTNSGPDLSSTTSSLMSTSAQGPSATPYSSVAHTLTSSARDDDISASELDSDSDSDSEDISLSIRRGIALAPLELDEEEASFSSSQWLNQQRQKEKEREKLGKGQGWADGTGDSATLRTVTKASRLGLKRKIMGEGQGQGRKKGKVQREARRGRGVEEEGEGEEVWVGPGAKYRQPRFERIDDFKGGEVWQLCHTYLTAPQRAEAAGFPRHRYAALLALINDAEQTWGLIDTESGCASCKKAGHACVAMIGKQSHEDTYRIRQLCIMCRLKNRSCDLSLKIAAKSKTSGRKLLSGHVSMGGGSRALGTGGTSLPDDHDQDTAEANIEVAPKAHTGSPHDTAAIASEFPGTLAPQSATYAPPTVPRVPLDPTKAAQQVARSIHDLRTVFDYACRTLRVSPNSLSSANPLSDPATEGRNEDEVINDELEVAYMLHDGYQAVIPAMRAGHAGECARDADNTEGEGEVSKRDERMKDDIEDAQAVMDELRELLWAKRPGEATEWFLWKGDRALRKWREALET